MTTVRAARAIIFDLDGTLVDTVGVRVTAWMDVFPAFGIETDREAVGLLMGSDGKLVARTVAESVGQSLQPGVDAEIDRVAGERFAELNRRPLPLAGASEILEFLEEADLPFPESMAFDKSSPNRFGKGPQHTYRSHRTKPGEIVPGKVIKYRSGSHPQSCENRWCAGRYITTFMLFDLPTTPIHQLQVVFQVVWNTVRLLISKGSQGMSFWMKDAFLNGGVI